MIGRPTITEFAPVAAGYVTLVPEDDVLGVLEAQTAEVHAFSRTISPDRETFSYATGKWTLREMFGHVADSERVFGYRAFCISRGEEQPLPGFDEQAYTARGGFAARPLADLVQEFALLRESNLMCLRHLDPTSWQRMGTANNTPVSVRALAFILAGHVRHHLHIAHTRYV